ncbi:Magnesium chelatase, H subunit [Sulfitobacter noctilucicola]|uniref:cobaltochelatase subunit CobN n=1 Tax=Sulfitobacter noctilucicola TaxID=1342301 RepID=UPI0004684732|nr:cobaltochelatase subunit CobN [Sulfitobacter noctilucicola]KIN69974.1 Magnesium chelatase, H subunit [Sulfitobacter noctilucicola]
MRDDVTHKPYNVVLLTLDRHAAGPAARVAPRLAQDFDGLRLIIHAAAEWEKSPAALEAARADVARADIIVTSVIFLEDQVHAILDDLKARRDVCDAMINVIADQEIVQLTRMGDLDMSRPASGVMGLLKKLKPSGKSGSSGRDMTKMLRRLPKILRLIPGKSQDLRAWFLAMQYWLGGSDENIESMVRFILSRYATSRPEWLGTDAALPVEYPEVGLYHPDLPQKGIVTDLADMPVSGDGPTIGLLMLRSYILAGDTAHYDHVIRTFEARGMRVIPAFAGGLDGRPALDAYFGGIDAMVSLTGFSLVGGPAYNDSPAAVAALEALDVPYLSAQPLEFQTLNQWAIGDQGLSPIESTILIALPEIDGATNPTVFAGRHGSDGCSGCAHKCQAIGNDKAMSPCLERIDALADKAERLGHLRRKANADKTLAIVLFGFPPNAGAVGTAAYLAVFESLFNTLHRLADDGYDLTPPTSVDALREYILNGNAKTYGQEANIAATVSANQIVQRTPWLEEIEAVWGPAPGKKQSNGREVFILGAQFGKVFVGVQPTFGYEGDPMRLLFEGGFAPTHAFNAFYQYIKDDLRADAVLHFGMHGALEFMPGKQNGLCGADWPDRMIGNLPNIYLYAANNPSEATLAKRRSNAVTVTYLTPPLQTAGLYRGLADLKDSMQRWRAMPGGDPARGDIADLIAVQADAVDMDGTDPDTLWLQLLETEDALIPDGLHIVGKKLSAEERTDMLNLMDFRDAQHRADTDKLLSDDHELPALMRALNAQFISPVPGGDVIRAPEILPTGRNIHAFDPFRMPTAFAMKDGAVQAHELIETHKSLPRTVALVLWGSDNIKSNGVPMAQALNLMGAKPRFDRNGRLCGADLLTLEELGRARVDVIVTLSGIFRDLLPLQTKLMADAALQCAMADEPEALNPIRQHALAYMAEHGCDMKTAALRVFSNAEGAYGSNVNQMVDNSTFEDENDLADAYQARKSFAYGTDGEASQQSDLLQNTLANVDLAYQNLESVELGVTTVDHYFDTLGGIASAVKRAKGSDTTPIYIGDQTRGGATVRTLQDQVALETRARNLNPKYFEGLLKHGHEGVRQIEANITNTVGWSATTGKVEPWVYQQLSETFVLDDEMRKRLADLNPQASMRMANRLLEASDRDYWQPDEATLEALQNAADAIEDQLEGIAAE